MLNFTARAVGRLRLYYREGKSRSMSDINRHAHSHFTNMKTQKNYQRENLLHKTCILCSKMKQHLLYG